MSLCINRAVAGDRFNEKKPVFFTKIEHYIWHLAVLLNGYTKFSKPRRLKITSFIACISHADNFSSRRKAWSEFSDNLFNKFAVRAGSKFYFLAIRDCYRDHLHLAMFSPFRS